MESLHEVRITLEQARVAAQGSAAAFVTAQTLAAEAVAILQDVDLEGTSLVDPMRAFAEAHDGINPLLGILASFPDKYNPYLERNGMPPLEPIGAPQSEPIQLKANTASANASTPENDENARDKYYKKRVDAINKLIDEGIDPKQIDGYLAAGGICYVFVDEETDTVIKIPRVLGDGLLDLWDLSDEQRAAYEEEDPGEVYPAGTIDKFYKNPLEKGKGVPGLEQIVATIPDGGQAGMGAVICKRAPGRQLSDVPAEEQEDIPDEHYDRLVKTIKSMGERGLKLDNDPTNLMYDPVEGFTIIDYEVDERQESPLLRTLHILAETGREGNMLFGEHPDPWIRYNLLDAIEREYGNKIARGIEDMWQLLEGQIYNIHQLGEEGDE